MQGHSESTKTKNQHCMLLATKQAASLKRAITVGHFLCDLELDHEWDFANVYMT